MATEQHGREPAPEGPSSAPAGKQASLVDHYQDAPSADAADAVPEDTTSEPPIFLVTTADRID
ncbi:hypothetical protein [Rhodococcus opacus]|uniref:hypothetical protein n=1 Tax=Rhodococcus opacus TaxID=37919 RepID=UPI001F5A0953|nr:hypothetical protein [Rhodococcus opacus]UNN05000.1 hypothetical protein MOO23_39230 [Rhodococcus opacus]